MRLDIDNVSVRFGDTQALDHLSCSMESCGLTVVIGANASGKSTLMRAILGQIPLLTGSIRAAYPAGAAARAACSIGAHQLPAELTGWQVLKLASEALGSVSTDTSAAYASCVSARDYFDRPIVSCSMGTRQKICVALALVGNPSLVILDEALNGLDLLSESRSLEFLSLYTKEHDSVVFLVSHNLDISQHFSDWVWLLHEGKLLESWGPQALEELTAEGRSLSREVLNLLGNT